MNGNVNLFAIVSFDELKESSLRFPLNNRSYLPIFFGRSRVFVNCGKCLGKRIFYYFRRVIMEKTDNKRYSLISYEDDCTRFTNERVARIGM